MIEIGTNKATVRCPVCGTWRYHEICRACQRCSLFPDTIGVTHLQAGVPYALELRDGKRFLARALDAPNGALQVRSLYTGAVHELAHAEVVAAWPL